MRSGCGRAKLAPMQHATLGIDIGAETVKLVTLTRENGSPIIAMRRSTPHHKDPHSALRMMLTDLDISTMAGIAVTGRLRRIVTADSVPTKAAMSRGVRVTHPELDRVTVIALGARGFSVLETHGSGQDWYRQNSRCSQGTGNFLSQLVRRFGLDVDEASQLCESVTDPAVLSGRCPVILKTDMTHLANRGEDRARILAGLYDAVCENVLTLIRPRLAPPDVILVGGVARSARVRRTIEKRLSERGLVLHARKPEDDFLEAVGAAVHAMECGGTVARCFEDLAAATNGATLDQIPPLRLSLSRVHRLSTPQRGPHGDRPDSVLMGLDIGSTGSKAVVLDSATGEPSWEAYIETEGMPVRAAQRLVGRWLDEVSDRPRIVEIGVTGSGREVVGSLLRSCFGDGRIFVLNEIAAHARGAIELDPLVDTIFEIGGQDAKFIRLEQGRVIDAAMNEACSAGTGSFIAEQGAKFDGIGDDVQRLSALALRADKGISLGQHCSVFMAEVIDQAIAEGADRKSIIAGLHDSVIQNYLNRVKGSRSIGERIFCQGMPFKSEALAAAVARQTGRDVVVPANPGTIGALGIGLLACDQLDGHSATRAPLDLPRFLEAEVTKKETLHCPSTKGCGSPGNRCRLDRLTTRIGNETQRFVWGGNCSLHSRGAGRCKLPDLAPNPFVEREALLDALIKGTGNADTRGRIGLSDEFVLKQLAPLFVVFLQELGFRCHVLRRPDVHVLSAGIEGARVPYCAPVQMAHGVYLKLGAHPLDFILLPMFKSLPRIAGEEYGSVCPMVMAAPDLVESLLPREAGTLLRPVIEIDAAGVRGTALAGSLRRLAEGLDAVDHFTEAMATAVAAQEQFDLDVRSIGLRAIDFARGHSVLPIAVLGRPYTIYNDILNSNVPNILRSLGALPIPVDCLNLDQHVPVFEHQYWAHTQLILRAADQVRRTPDLYSVFCSNYGCGPDSFTLHFHAYLMQNKPYGVVETDGHSGDAGTQTRMEAFLTCVDDDRRSGASVNAPRGDFAAIDDRRTDWDETRTSQSRVFVPKMGSASLVAAAALRAEGFRAQALPLSNRDDVLTGRKHTSGKECIPLMLTIGTLINTVNNAENPDEPVTFFMPTAHGPCRFGVYHTLQKIVLERAGLDKRISLVIPDGSDYFEGMSPEFTAKLWVGFVVHDLLEMMLHEIRPVERHQGTADTLHGRCMAELVDCLERAPRGRPFNTVLELAGGMWGMRRIAERAAEGFAALRDPHRDVPTVSLVGEIYVRLEPFSNDFIVQKLEDRGLRVRCAPFIEWLEYSTFVAAERVRTGRSCSTDDPLKIGITGLVQRVTLNRLYRICARRLGWGPRLTVADSIEAAAPYVHRELTGEAQLTVGAPIVEYQHGLIDGAVIVGPHECMPCRVSEAQYGLASEQIGIPFLNIEINGDPIDTDALDRFAYDIHHHPQRSRNSVREHT